MKPGGGSSYSDGQSAVTISSPRLSRNTKTSDKIFKLNHFPKSKFKLRLHTKDGSTESGVERDWLGKSANRKPGSSRMRNNGL